MTEKDIAIFELGGKQYLAGVGDIIDVYSFDGEAEEGKSADTDKVLLKYNSKDKKTEIGSPYISKGKVKFKVLESGKGKKVSVIKYKSKSRYFRNKGHRQDYTKIEITAI